MSVCVCNVGDWDSLIYDMIYMTYMAIPIHDYTTKLFLYLKNVVQAELLQYMMWQLRLIEHSASYNTLKTTLVNLLRE